MLTTFPGRAAVSMAFGAAIVQAVLLAQAPQRAGGENPFPGGTNPDGSLRPTPPVSRLFTQDAYTEYALLDPASQAFRIRFLPEETRAGATELVNATRGGSAGSDIAVFDPRTGEPLKFTYEQAGADADSHAIHALLPAPVPEGGIGRVLIEKTYADPRTYMTRGEDIVWVRSLSGYRLGVLLPKGFAFISSNVAAQLTTMADGRLKLAFANPSGQSNPVTIHARKTTAAPEPPSTRTTGAGVGAGAAEGAAAGNAAAATDMFFDDVKTLYDLEATDSGSGRVRVEQIYSDYRKGDAARLDSLSYLALQDLTVIDLDTAKPLPVAKRGAGTVATLALPIVNDKQSAHLKLTGTLAGANAGYRVEQGTLVFDRTLHGLRNTVLLPAGWDVSAVSQSATLGTYQGRAFVALINLNAENTYKVTIRARKR
jgi:hypothetical protein